MTVVRNAQSALGSYPRSIANVCEGYGQFLALAGFCRESPVYCAVVWSSPIWHFDVW